MYDTIIIGMGPAGMSAGIYAKRAGLNVLMIDENAPGGLLNKITVVENYLGFKSISGPDLASNMFEHILNEKVPFKLARVTNVVDENGIKKVTTTKGEFTSKGLIIATGRKPRKSGLINENKFIGKGISYCAICDAPLFKNKKLCVLGGGNSAFEEALYLSKFASEITIITKYDITAEEKLVQEIKNKNINIINNGANEFFGEDTLKGIILDDGSFIECDGAFVYYGYESDTSFIKSLEVENINGYIIVDNKMKTNIDKVYACGDIIKKDVYQIVTGISEGAIAAIQLKNDLK